jgi:hypothetical protein
LLVNPIGNIIQALDGEDAMTFVADSGGGDGGGVTVTTRLGYLRVEAAER